MEQAAVVRAAEPGCLVYRPHRSTADPDLFIFYEQYVDDAAFDAHRRAPHLAQFRERREAQGLIEGGAEVEIYRSLTD
jgi:quinol monooxygenase YgiN